MFRITTVRGDGTRTTTLVQRDGLLDMIERKLETYPTITIQAIADDAPDVSGRDLIPNRLTFP